MLDLSPSSVDKYMAGMKRRHVTETDLVKAWDDWNTALARCAEIQALEKPEPGTITAFLSKARHDRATHEVETAAKTLDALRDKFVRGELVNYWPEVN